MSGLHFSIAPCLPLQVDHSSGSLRWVTSVEYALKGIARGPEASKVNSAQELYNCIEDIRTENGDLKPLSPQIAVGLSRLCDEIEDAGEFFRSTLPSIAKLSVQLPDLLEHHQREIRQLSGVDTPSMTLRVLSPQQSGMVLLHQHLIASLLGCAFFCLYPDNGELRKTGLANINFDGLYIGILRAGKSNIQKLLCLIHYFNRVGSNVPEGTVSFERKVLPLMTEPKSRLPMRYPNDSFWSDSRQSLCDMKVIEDGAIEDAGSEYLQVDFANEQLGGGALYTGSVQEEIRFMISPECIAGILFLPAMNDNESIEITGAEMYCQYTGYSRKFCFAGGYTDNTPRDSWGRRKTCIVAIDALCLPGESQFEDELMIRELNKAYCGFLNHSNLCGYSGTPDLGRNFTSIHDSELSSISEFEDNYEVRLNAESVDHTFSSLNTCGSDEGSQGICVIHQKIIGVATGNWGSGAFGGNLQLKSLLQWLAASQAGCSVMCYYSFGDIRSQRLQELVDWILREQWCVSELWSILQQYGKCRMNRQVKSELYDWILPQGNTDFNVDVMGSE